MATVGAAAVVGAGVGRGGFGVEADATANGVKVGAVDF
jgi:hypothetical protein